jgi:hypothetical protein
MWAVWRFLSLETLALRVAPSSTGWLCAPCDFLSIATNRAPIRSAVRAQWFLKWFVEPIGTFQKSAIFGHLFECRHKTPTDTPVSFGDRVVRTTARILSSWEHVFVQWGRGKWLGKNGIFFVRNHIFTCTDINFDAENAWRTANTCAVTPSIHPSWWSSNPIRRSRERSEKVQTRPKK